jgi:phage I-like protein
LIAFARASLVIDYETDAQQRKDSQPAPALAGCDLLDRRRIYAGRTHGACQGLIESKEYLYISPVFEYPWTGTVLAIHMAALPTPALHGMDPLTLRRCSSAFLILPTQQEPP